MSDDKAGPDAQAHSPARELFEQSVDRLDTGTGNALRLMRRKVLADRPKAMRVRWLASLGTAALLVLAVGALWPGFRDPPSVQPVASLPATEELMLSDDLDQELYAWLGDAPVAVEPEGSAL